MTNFPQKLPWHANYSLKLEGNDIGSLPNADYLSRVYSANLSDNDISDISNDAFYALPKGTILDLRQNRVGNIPSKLTIKLGEGLILGSVEVKCGCDMTWLLDWSVYGNNGNNIAVSCENYEGQNIFQLKSQLASDCYIGVNVLYPYILGIVGLILFLISFLYMMYRPEIYILYATLIRQKIGHSKKDFLHDVYVCFDENNAYARIWLLKALMPSLKEKGYKVYLPCRDEPIGESLGISRCQAIDNSRNFIVLLTETGFGVSCADTYTHPTTIVVEQEFSHIWYTFKKNPCRRVVIINFDSLIANNVHNRYLKAFLRTHMFIDFCNRFQRIIDLTQERLGKPQLTW